MTAKIGLGSDHPSLVSTVSVNRYLKYTNVILEREVLFEELFYEFSFDTDFLCAVIIRLYCDV
jgi:hypothetical protein